MKHRVCTKTSTKFTAIIDKMLNYILL